MAIICSGLSYKTAPIELQEQLSIAVSDPEAAMRSLASQHPIGGAMILSTCNRFEIYLDSDDEQAALMTARSFIEERMGREVPDLRELRERDAINHLIRVACSLESRIIGETQILSQVKQALDAAQQAQSLTEDLSKLVKCAITAGKRVRSETALGIEPVSLSSVALRMAERRLGGLEGRSVLLVGSGEMGRVAASYLAEKPLASLALCSRTLGHAEALADEYGLSVIPFEDCVRHAAESDLVFVAVRTDRTVIRADDLEDARKEAGTQDRPMMIIDEGMPRNVDHLCRYIDNVDLIDLDTLNNELDDAIHHRRDAAAEAWEIVDDAAEGYNAWLQERYVTPTIREISRAADSTVDRESARAGKALSKELGRELTPAELEIIEAYGRAVKKRILHDPIIRLRREAHSPQSSNYTLAARYLFGLESDR